MTILYSILAMCMIYMVLTWAVSDNKSATGTVLQWMIKSCGIAIGAVTVTIILPIGLFSGFVYLIFHLIHR